MDLEEEIKSREEREIGSESREKGDLLPCLSTLCYELELSTLNEVTLLYIT